MNSQTFTSASGAAVVRVARSNRRHAAASAAIFPTGRQSPDAAPCVSHKPRPPKLYRIGEVVEYSGMSRQTIHNYTTMGLLHESRWTVGGHRLYDESVFERLDVITQFRSRNMSLDDIRNRLEAQDGPERASHD